MTFLRSFGGSLIKENITALVVSRHFLRGAKERLNNALINRLDIIVVKDEPLAGTLNNGNIVALIGAAKGEREKRRRVSKNEK